MSARRLENRRSAARGNRKWSQPTMKCEQPWFLRQIACRSASAGQHSHRGKAGRARSAAVAVDDAVALDPRRHQRRRTSSADERVDQRAVDGSGDLGQVLVRAVIGLRWNPTTRRQPRFGMPRVGVVVHELGELRLGPVKTVTRPARQSGFWPQPGDAGCSSSVVRKHCSASAACRTQTPSTSSTPAACRPVGERDPVALRRPSTARQTGSAHGSAPRSRISSTALVVVATHEALKRRGGAGSEHVQVRQLAAGGSWSNDSTPSGRSPVRSTREPPAV